ncbi:MAG: hypothetical protein IJ532_03635 [Alphaproteobacteria bacterium]|nr:hypothetical protein [Alphaproteobacteria bacterium]
MSGRIVNNLIEVRQGDSFNIMLQISSCGEPADLANNIVRMQVRDEQNNIMFELTGNVVDENNGKVVLCITPQESSIEVGDYKCDVQLETADGSTNTIFPLNVNQIGVFRITPQVTTKEN